MVAKRGKIQTVAQAAVMPLVVALAFSGTAHANGMGTPIEPAKREATLVPAATECDVLVTTETAAAITSDLQSQVAGIGSTGASDIPVVLANAAASTVRKHGVVTPACPCADNALSFVVATLLQQAAAAGISEDDRNSAVGILRAQLAADMGYPQQCVASAIGEGLASNDEATGAIAELIDNGNRGFPGDTPSLLTDRASASGR